MWFSTPEVGDWVRLKRRTPVSFSDHLTDGGLPAGSRACVLGRTGSRLELEVDAGWGSTRVSVRSHDVTVIRRGGGSEAFARRVRLVTTVRVSLALVLVWPVLQFVATYLWVNRTFEDIVPAFVMGVLDGLPEQIEAAIAEPWKAVLSFLLFAVMGRIAFGPKST